MNNGPEQATEAAPMSVYMSVLKPTDQDNTDTVELVEDGHVNDDFSEPNTLNLTMKAPPQKEFDTKEQLLQYVREFGMTQGYIATIKTSNKDKNMYIGCDRSGSFRDRIGDKRRRRKLSRKKGCPFLLYAKRSKHDKWTFLVREERHNHEPDDASKHPIARRLTERQLDIVRQHVIFGSPPRVILSDLREQFPDIQVTNRDIYNAKMQIESKMSEHKHPTEYLDEYMDSNGWRHDMLQDADGQIQCLFFAHEKSLDLGRRHNAVYFLDLVSKTNRYGMPMLHFVGVTSAGGVFSIAFCFMKTADSDASNFIWALNSFKTHLNLSAAVRRPVLATDYIPGLMNSAKEIFPTWPNVICPWFVRTDVKRAAHTAFGDGVRPKKFMHDFNALIQSSTPDEFSLKWEELQREYSSTGAQLFAHIASVWLPVKELFVSAWIGLPHAEAAEIAASHAEESRSYIRSHLTSTTADLRQVFRNVDVAVAEQQRRIQSSTGELLAALHDMEIGFIDQPRNLDVALEQGL